MTSRVLIIRSGDVIGKKGRLTKESLAEVTGRAPSVTQPGPAPAKKMREIEDGTVARGRSGFHKRF